MWRLVVRSVCFSIVIFFGVAKIGLKGMTLCGGKPSSLSFFLSLIFYALFQLFLFYALLLSILVHVIDVSN
jgi:hypothetical protein